MNEYNPKLIGKYLYYGSLGINEPQYKSGKFIGLALRSKHEFEIVHNAYDPLPVQDNSIAKIQAQDVFEHLEYSSIPKILDHIYRALIPNGVFRLSVPDYHSPLLRRRTAFDENGDPIADLMMDTQVVYETKSAQRKVIFKNNGNAHLWFPTYHIVIELIIKSQIRKCSEIIFYQYFIDKNNWKVDNFPENDMHVHRSFPFDTRSDGKPISIIVDFIK